MFFRLVQTFEEHMPDSPMTVWIPVVNIDIMIDTQNIELPPRDLVLLRSPNVWGRLGISFPYSPRSDLTMIFDDPRDKNLEVSYTAGGRTLSVFEKVFFTSYEIGPIHQDDQIIAEARWLFEHTTRTSFIINEKPKEQPSDISWQKYGF